MPVFRFSPRTNRANEIPWRTWGAEAFAEAKRRDVPVLLGISAVWCHWCHVMDETTYSTPEIIGLIRDGYVAVRVDNDERPDVNRRYNMGGWPTTAFLTPDGEILHGGTYIDPQTMLRTLEAVSELWKDKRDDLLARVADMKRREAEARALPSGRLTPEVVDTVAALVSGQYDSQYGGFGREPKFPQTRALRFVLHDHLRRGGDERAQIVRTTLDAMAHGGMYDDVEGGFFRYATQRDWSVPHYEKMLEDNAELLALYADAHRVFPDRGYDAVARDVIRWMDAVLYQPAIGLWSGSQDADEHYYTLDAEGRAQHDAPFVDRTVYTSWNALAASAYARAADALGDASLRERASRAADAIAARLEDRGALRRSDGEGPGATDLLGDIAAVLTLALDLGDVARATTLATRMRERLADGQRGGFFDTPQRDEPGRLGARERPIEENAMAAEALLRLAAMSGDESWHEIAVATLQSFANEYRAWGQFAASYADAVARALAEPVSVVVVGGPDADALWRALAEVRHPDLVTLRLDPERDRALVEERGFPRDRAAAYVCVGSSCSAPLSDEGSLRRELAARDRAATPA